MKQEKNKAVKYSSETRVLLSVIAAAGGQERIALRLGVKQSTVSSWITRGRIPVKRCLQLQALYGLDPFAIRPDIDWDILKTIKSTNSRCNA